MSLLLSFQRQLRNKISCFTGWGQNSEWWTFWQPCNLSGVCLISFSCSDHQISPNDCKSIDTTLFHVEDFRAAFHESWSDSITGRQVAVESERDNELAEVCRDYRWPESTRRYPIIVCISMIFGACIKLDPENRRIYLRGYGTIIQKCDIVIGYTPKTILLDVLLTKSCWSFPSILKAFSCCPQENP